MCSYDFEYDGRYLSEFGFIICDFSHSSGPDSVTAGSNISFNTVSRTDGKKRNLVGTKYGDCISASFDICKNPDEHDDAEMKVTDYEFREMMRWLNRREFLPFQVFDDDDPGKDRCYFNASFNIEKIVMDDTLIGLRLSMETDSPFGYGDKQESTWEIDDNSIVYTDVSDEIGYIYPELEITCGAAGTLQLNNDRMDTPMIIANCSAGEVISIDGEAQIITSSVSAHKIMDDFNFNFFKIINSYDNRINVISSSIPITIKMSYVPYIKNSV